MAKSQTSDDIQLLHDWAMKTRLLKREEMDELSRRWQEEKDRRAFDRMVVANLRLVFKFAERFRRRGLEYGDLVQEGVVGLMTAVDKFDRTRGKKFSTYAAWWIKHGMNRAISDQARHVRIPVNTAGKYNRAVKNVRRLAQRCGWEMTVADVAAYLGIDELLATAIGQQVTDHINSLDCTAESEGRGRTRNGTGTITYKDMIKDESLPADDRVDSTLATSWASAILNEALSVLTPKQRQVVDRYILKDPPDSLHTIGEDYGVTHEAVRKWRNQALRKMRFHIAARGLEDKCVAILDMLGGASDRQGYGDCVERSSTLLGPPASICH